MAHASEQTPLGSKRQRKPSLRLLEADDALSEPAEGGSQVQTGSRKPSVRLASMPELAAKRGRKRKSAASAANIVVPARASERQACMRKQPGTMHDPASQLQEAAAGVADVQAQLPAGSHPAEQPLQQPSAGRPSYKRMLDSRLHATGSITPPMQPQQAPAATGPQSSAITAQTAKAEAVAAQSSEPAAGEAVHLAADMAIRPAAAASSPPLAPAPAFVAAVSNAPELQPPQSVPSSDKPRCG